MQLNNKIIELLNIINKLDFVSKEKLNLVLEKVNNLDEVDKIELLRYMISSSLLKLDVLDHKDYKFNCETLGHDFGEWECTFLEKYENKNEYVKYWKRHCTRCGLIEVSSVNPIEEEKGMNK